MESSSHRSLSFFISFVTALLVVATLYFGRQLFMPLALACLFTFLLHPVVKFLCAWHLPRAISVGLVTLSSFSTLILIAWLLGGEMARLANDLPRYQPNIQQRVNSVQKLGDSKIITSLRKLAGGIRGSKELPTQPVAAPSPAPQAPSPVTEGEGLVMKSLNMVVPTLATALETASVVALFVIFMLLRLDDISHRVVRLVGFSRLTVTTRAIDEASARVTRYLIMQGTVNTIYGLLVAAGMAAVGMPYVILWGVLAGMFRFVPYVGATIVATLLTCISLAVFDGWTLPLIVVAMIITLELVTGMIIEPLLYGHSAGISDFALLVAIAFWTWVWGGFGLILATPLTVCIVVFCKHIPSLEWVDLVMSENPPPQPHLSYYQQHLADDEDAAQALIESSLQEDGAEKTLEDIALPALALTRREEVLGRLDPPEAAQIYQNMQSMLALVKEETEEQKKAAEQRTGNDPPPRNIKVFARALQGAADAQALDMLRTILPTSISLEISAEPHLIGELVQKLEEKKPALLCVSAMPPHSQVAAGILCRRLRSTLPELKILVCRWGLPGQEFNPKPLRESGATWVVSSLKQAREILERMIS